MSILDIAFLSQCANGEGEGGVTLGRPWGVGRDTKGAIEGRGERQQESHGEEGDTESGREIEECSRWREDCSWVKNLT